MASYGYNLVHVGINQSEIGRAHGSGLRPRYVRNLASFISIARADNIRVAISLLGLPIQGGYLPASYTRPGALQNHNNNMLYLGPHFVAGEQTYLADLINGLRSAGANLSDVFSYELVGEQYMDGTDWPLSIRSGKVHTWTGTYDMASASSRSALIDDALLRWQNTLVDELHRLSPRPLVSLGFFAPYATRLDPPGTERIVRMQSAFSTQSSVDFVDLHLYPVFGSLVDQLNSTGVFAPSVTKPVILGEFGAYKSDVASPASAAALLEGWQIQSCRVDGWRLDGWVTWTWDTTAAEQPGIYNMLDGHGAIARVLSPSKRPDPCR